MEEKENKEIYDKMIVGFNMILGEIDEIKKQNSHIIDQLDPTYTNVKSIHGMVDSLVKEIKMLEIKINRLEEKIDLLKQN